MSVVTSHWSRRPSLHHRPSHYPSHLPPHHHVTVRQHVTTSGRLARQTDIIPEVASTAHSAHCPWTPPAAPGLCHTAAPARPQPTSSPTPAQLKPDLARLSPTSAQLQPAPAGADPQSNSGPTQPDSCPISAEHYSSPTPLQPNRIQTPACLQPDSAQLFHSSSPDQPSLEANWAAAVKIATRALPEAINPRLATTGVALVAHQAHRRCHCGATMGTPRSNVGLS